MPKKFSFGMIIAVLFGIITLNTISTLIADNTCSPVTPPTTGPDVIVGLIGDVDGSDISNWGTVGNITAFSFATTSCNKGNQPLNWISNTPDHPVISQNLFRLLTSTTDTSTGEPVSRFEQIGMAWLKHGFFATNQTDCCDTCNAPGGNALQPSCSDLYVSQLNGGQFGGGRNLGPRSTVNAGTGVFPYPFTLPASPSVIDRRLQVNRADVISGNQARYFLEGQYVTKDDAAAGNKNNNASYREAVLSTDTTGVKMVMKSGSTTVVEQAAITAWKTAVPSVSLFNVDVPNDGRLIVAISSTQLQGNRFHHEIAIHNLNSDRSVQAARFEHANGGTIDRPGFHAPRYHSGEPYSNAVWTPAISPNSIQWSSETFASNTNANALRWGTCYSFNYESATLPTNLVLTLFKPGNPSEVQQTLGGNALNPAASMALAKNDRNWATLPRTIDLGTVSTRGQTLHVPHAPGVHEEIVGVESSNPDVTITATDAFDGHVNGWQLQVQKSKNANAADAYFETLITLKPKSKDKKPLTIRAYGELK